MKGFVEEYANGQRWLRLTLPEGEPCADVRLFMRGRLLDGTKGLAGLSREALVPLLGASLPLLAPRQVHGVKILDSLKENVLTDKAGPSAIEADGIFLDSPGMEASLRFADCAPVVVMPLRKAGQEQKNPWVLLLHSGYKGTVQNIVGSGLEKVKARYGTSLDSACAWIGPCIGGANYPRDREEWTNRGLDVFRKENARIEGEKVFFDIAGELAFQLGAAGIASERIFLSGLDTVESSDRCYSYRGGDREDRMFLWAKLFA